MKIARTAAWTILLLIFSACLASGAPTTVRILHVNDFHGFAEPYTPYDSAVKMGGIAWLAAEVGKLRVERPSLLLAAGDMIQGNDWANLFKGKPVIELMNMMKFDAMTVGNHEFDFGSDVLRKRIDEARFPVLGANVQGIANLRPYVIKEVAGIRIAVIGVVTEDTPVATHPKNVVGLKFMPVRETLARYLTELRGKADVMVLLSHEGYQEDRKVAETVPGIDIIVGGHSHTRIDKPVRVGDTVIVQAWEHAKALGVLDVTVDDGKVVSIEGRLEEIRPDRGAPDPAVKALVEKYREKANLMLDGVVGNTTVFLDGENVRKKETNFGDLVADIMRNVSHAEIAIINGGSIRASIARGPITARGVYSALPFDNYIVAVRLTGKELREALEHGVAGIDEGAGAFPQVSGLSFSYDPAAPPGSRVREVSAGDRPLEPGREYTVATNDFLAAGGDGYRAFGDAIRSSRDFAVIGGMLKGERLVFSDSGRWLRDLFTDYLKEHKSIAPTTGGRIKVVH